MHFYESKLNSWNQIHFIQLSFFCSTIFVINAFCFRTLSLKLSRETLNNGSLYLHLFVLPRQVIVKKWSEASKASDSVYTRVALSHYQVPSSATYQLLSGKNLSPTNLNLGNPKVSFPESSFRDGWSTIFSSPQKFVVKQAIICKYFKKYN